MSNDTNRDWSDELHFLKKSANFDQALAASRQTGHMIAKTYQGMREAGMPQYEAAVASATYMAMVINGAMQKGTQQEEG